MHATASQRVFPADLQNVSVLRGVSVSYTSFVGKEDMYVRDGLHLSGKGAAVFAEGLSGAVASGLGKVRYLN